MEPTDEATVRAPRAGELMSRDVDRDVTPLALVIDMEDQALERLLTTVQRIEDRLGPVLSPHPPRLDEVATLLEERNEASTVVEHGYRHISVIQGITDRLEYALGRLEV